MQLLGHITLNLSLSLYLLWFIPQLLLNARRHNTEGLSYLMHGLLFIGYLADLLYGFGRDMQWQYQMVTIIGLFCLSYQHDQIRRYGLQSRVEKIVFAVVTLVILLGFSAAIYDLTTLTHSKAYYDAAGMVSNICWFSFTIPQIIKNYRQKSTQGLSLMFVMISIFICVFDNISAWALYWDYPSKIGLPLSLLKKIILLWQFYNYSGKSR